MKKLTVIILFLNTLLCAQNVVNTLTTALDAYYSSDYGTAYRLFSSIIAGGKLEEEKLGMARYYAADCLMNMNEPDGAIPVFEAFITEYPYAPLREQALYKLGTLYYSKGDYFRCRERMKSLIAGFRSSDLTGTANYWIAQSYFRQDNYIEAEESFKEAIALPKTNKFMVFSIYSLAQLYEKTNNDSSAIKYYDDLLSYYKEDPLAPEAQMRIGVCYFNLNKFDNTIIELSDPLIKKLPGERLFEAKIYLANSFSRLKEYKQSIRIYDELLQQVQVSGYHDKIKYNLAWMYFQLADYGDAYKIFNELSDTAVDSLKKVSLFWSGECKRYSGDSQSANAIYKNFIDKYPEHPLASRAQLAIGSDFYNESNPVDAEKALLNATLSSDVKTRGKALTVLGELKLNKKDFSSSGKYFTDALKLTGDRKDLNDRARLGLAVTDFYKNNYDEAVKYLEELKSKSGAFESDKVNFYLAESYFAQGKYPNALKAYNSIPPSDIDLKKQTLLGKAYSYFNLKDFPNAIYYFTEFTSQYRNDAQIPDAKLRLADAYFGTRKFDKASAIYKDVFSSEKVSLGSDHAYYQYGQSLFKAGKPAEAIRAFNDLQKKFPRSKYRDQSQYIIGWIHFQQGAFQEAIESYKEIVNEYPKSQLRPMVLYSIGDGYFNLAQYDSSIYYYSTVIRDFPNTQYVFDAVNGIQYAYVAKGDPGKAIEYIDQFISTNPSSKTNDQIYFKKGDLYYSVQKYQQAFDAYQDFCSQYPESKLVPNAYFWMGKCELSMKNDQKALECFLNASRNNLKTDIGISSVIETASIYSNKLQFKDAINILDQAVGAQPSSNRTPELLFLKGVNEERDNEQSAAFNTLNRIIDEYQGSVFVEKAKVEVGLIELQRKNIESAQKYFKEVAEKRPDDTGAEAQYYYGASLYDQNKIQEAITELVRVRSVYSLFDEWYTRSLLMLGNCYIKLNDKKQARDMFKTVLSKHPTGEFAQEAKRKLNKL